MSIVFFHSPMSSASPVAWALAELGVPHERVHVDLKAGDQKKPEILKLNPNGKVPTLVADGTPMFESLAIMMWLGERYGVEKKLWPAQNDPARMQAMAWSTWGYVSVGPSLAPLFRATSDRFGPEFKSPALVEHAKGELANLLAILDKHFDGKAYVLGDAFTLTDVILGGVVGFAGMVGAPVAAYPRVADWLARLAARPAYKENA